MTGKDMQPLEVIFLAEDSEEMELSRLYWEQKGTKFVHSLSVLALRFGFPKHEIPRIVKRTCLARDPGDVCPDCQTAHVYHTRSESELRAYSTPNQLCDSCKAQHTRDEAEARAADARTLRYEIRSCLQSHGEGVFFPDELSLREAVHLLSFISASQSLEEGRFVVSNFPHKLSPTDEFNRQVVRELYLSKLIGWDESSPPDAFVRDANGDIDEYYPARIVWRLSMREDSGESIRAIYALDAFVREKEWPWYWHDERAEIWREIAAQECLEFLNFSVDECSFPQPPSDKALAVIRDLLSEYSVGQVCHIVWRSMQYATHQHARGFMNKEHAVNYLLKAMRKRAEDAKVNGWQIYAFDRNAKLPISTISLWFSKVFLKLDPKDAFQLPISTGTTA